MPRSRATEWLLGRIAVKEAARDWIRLRLDVDMPSADIEILDGPHGQPTVRVPASIGAHAIPGISIDHSEGVHAAIAFDLSRPMCIAIEHMRSLNPFEADAIVVDEREQRLIARLDGPERDRARLAFRCAKTAAAKARDAGSDVTGDHCYVNEYDVGTNTLRVTRGTEQYGVSVDVSDGVLRAVARREELEFVNAELENPLIAQIR
jgi:hypothetical protein